MEFFKRLYPILSRIDECFKSNNNMAFLHNKFRNSGIFSRNVSLKWRKLDVEKNVNKFLFFLDFVAERCPLSLVKFSPFQVSKQKGKKNVHLFLLVLLSVGM